MRGHGLLALALFVTSCASSEEKNPSSTEATQAASGPSEAVLGPGAWTSLDVNGTTQWLLTRGSPTAEATLLFVHGGPGVPTSPMSYAFDAPYLDHFTVVHWDQRAAGKSAATLPPPESMTIEQFVADAQAVLAHLKAAYPDRPLVLAGHSWGTLLAQLAAARSPDLVDHLVLIGCVVDIPRTQEIQLAYFEAHDVVPDGLAPLPWNTLDKLIPAAQAINQAGLSMGALGSRWGERFAGSVDYTDADRASLNAGNHFTLSHMVPQVASWKVTDELARFAMPVTFIHGELDMSTPLVLVEERYESLEAPRKDLVVRKGMAHFVMWEDNVAVAQALREHL